MAGVVRWGGGGGAGPMDGREGNKENTLRNEIDDEIVHL